MATDPVGRLDTDNIDFMGEDDKAAELVDNEYWDIATLIIDTVYQGIDWTLRYLGIRPDAALYLGAGTLR